jgi:FdhE protein
MSDLKLGPKSVPKTGTVLGEIAKPPFAVLPDPASLFAQRARRLAVLAPGHQLEPYLRFVAAATQAQHDILPLAEEGWIRGSDNPFLLGY